MAKKKRILWVTFDFPPRQSSGVFRPIKIYKYLDKDAFDIEFLTQSATQPGMPMDPTLLEEVVPPPTVHRVPNIVLSSYVDGMARPRDGNGKKHERQTGPAESGARPVRSGWRALPRRAAKRIYVLLAMILYFPDQYFVWGWLAAFKALSLHLRNRYDLVYTTSHPESGHLAGLVLELFGVKWVADYRYAGILWIKKLLTYPKKRVREWSEFRYQARVLRKADAVITQSETIKENFREAFGVEADRMTVISSGYDEQDFAGLNGHPPPFERAAGEIHVLHAGASYLDVADQNRLMEVINRLGEELRREGKGIVLHALGDDLFRPELKPGIRGFRYFFHGFVPHFKLAPYLAAAHWYLLLTVTSVSGAGTTDGYLPSKMWEYMRGGKPILLFGPPDEVWRIIDHAGAGLYMGRFESQAGVSAPDLVERVRSLAPIASRVEQHSWKSRARSMQQVFSALLEGQS